MMRIMAVWVNILVLILVLSAPISPESIIRGQPILSSEGTESHLQDAQNGFSFYSPLVFKNYPPPPTTFGVETGVLDNTDILDRVKNAKAYRVRSHVFSWNLIEPEDTTPENYHWETVNGQALIDASVRGLYVIATIKMTPSWAQKYPGVSCGPIKQNKFDAFAEFLQAVVRIYGNSPYNVKYWELGNEPDVDRSLVPPDNHFGCWGEESDTYYGGGYYGDMLKVAYPAIKSIDPNAQVLIGGLLLDCDPTHPPTDEGKTCKPGKFLEGILRNGGENYFDIVSFHGYPNFAIYQDPGRTFPQYLYYDENHKYWATRGGIILGKIDFLREVMAAYGVNKPIIASEAALTCAGCSLPNPVYEEAQADYVVWLYIRNWAAGVLGTTWYTIEGPGWRNSGLLDGGQNPKPAYNVLSFITRELVDATYQGQIVQYPELRGYQFGKTSKRIWVLWAPDEQPYTINLPAGVLVVYDKYGTAIPQSGQITVKSPVFVELTP